MGTPEPTQPELIHWEGYPEKVIMIMEIIRSEKRYDPDVKNIAERKCSVVKLNADVVSSCFFHQPTVNLSTSLQVTPRVPIIHNHY